jgi:hypothetical protein
MITSEEPFVVEVWGKPVGVVIEDGVAFRFKALTHPFFALNDKEFSAPGYARVAAVRLHAERLADNRAPS